MDYHLIQMYAPDGIKPISHKPIVSGKSIKPEDISAILDSTFDKWTFNVDSEIVVGEILITNVTLYCEYGAFHGRAATNGTMDDYAKNPMAALLCACDRLIQFEPQKYNPTEALSKVNPDEITREIINKIATDTSMVSVLENAVKKPEELSQPSIETQVSVAQAIENNAVNIEPVDEEPVFSAENFMPDPPDHHDGFNNDERELMQREEIPFEEITPTMKQTMAEEIDMDNIPEKFTDEYRADIKKFMDDNCIPARENMNAHLERFEHGLNNQTLTPRKWVEFKRWWEQDRDKPIC